MKFKRSLQRDFKEFIFLLKMKFKLRIYMKLADYKHFITSDKYFVIPWIGGGMDVVSRHQIKERKNGSIKRRKKPKKGKKQVSPEKHDHADITGKTERKNSATMKHTDGYLEIKKKCFYETATERGGSDLPTYEERMAMQQRFMSFAGFAKKINPKI